MSRRIDQVIDVLAEIWARRHWISLMRAAAVSAVADRHGVNRTTVHSKLSRELLPSLNGIEDFDRLVTLWLYRDDGELRQVLLSRSLSVADQAAVERFFADPGWPSSVA